MRVESTTTMTNDVAKHKNNANVVAKQENDRKWGSYGQEQ